MDFSSQAIFGLGIVVIIHSKPEYILPSSSAIEYTTCLPTREDPSEQRFVTTHMSTDAFLLPALWYDLQGRDVHSVETALFVDQRGHMCCTLNLYNPRFASRV